MKITLPLAAFIVVRRADIKIKEHYRKRAREKDNYEAYYLSAMYRMYIFCVLCVICTIGCTKIWRLYQKITEPSQKLGLTIRRKHANF